MPSRRVRRRRALALRRLGDHLTRLGTRTAPRPRLISTRGTRGRVREHLGLHQRARSMAREPAGSLLAVAGSVFVALVSPAMRRRRASIANVRSRRCGAALLRPSAGGDAPSWEEAGPPPQRQGGGLMAGHAIRLGSILTIQHITQPKDRRPPEVFFLGARWCSWLLQKKRGETKNKKRKEIKRGPAIL